MHVAVTMDGNGRWAERRGLSRTAGHERGAEVALKIIDASQGLGIDILTLYGFSFENWQRDSKEVGFLFETLLPKMMKKVSKKAARKNIRLNVIGELERVPPIAMAELANAVDRTKDNDGVIVNIAVSYSGRREILSAVRAILCLHDSGEIVIDDLDEDLMSQHLFTKGQEDPDLHIRTGGMKRLSNFLMWQMAYTEQLFLEKLWPDFDVSDLAGALEFFRAQPRKFGRVEAIHGRI